MISDMHSSMTKVGLTTLAVGFASYAFSVSSTSLVGIKTTSSVVAQSVINKQINFVGVIGDTFFTPGYGDMLGSSFEVGISFENGRFYSRTVLDNKSYNDAFRQGLISTIFSVKLHGMDKFLKPGNELTQGLYTTSLQIGNYASQNF